MTEKQLEYEHLIRYSSTVLKQEAVPEVLKRWEAKTGFKVIYSFDFVSQTHDFIIDENRRIEPQQPNSICPP